MSESESPPTVQELFDLSDKTALVTGGSGHLGRALACALSEAGARVVVTSREAERAAAAAKALPDEKQRRHLGAVLDQMVPDSIQPGLDRILKQVGQIDVLVNNGHEATACDWTDVTPADFTRQLANATGYFQLARCVRDRAVERQQPASVIMIGSMYGQVASYPDAYEGVGPASPVAYQTLKGGIIQLTRHLAVYWAKDRIRVNCLSPGPFPAETAPRTLVERLESKSPLGRMGQPHELKGALLLLATEAGSYITGHNLVVDGGWTAW